MRCFSPTWKPHFIMVILLRKSTNYQKNIESNTFRMKSPVLFVFNFEKKKSVNTTRCCLEFQKNWRKSYIFLRLTEWHERLKSPRLCWKTHRRAVKLWNNILFLCFGGFGFGHFFSLISNISPSQRDRARACVCNEM